MQSERPRARRYRFVATVEVTDLATEPLFVGQTCDLSPFGCGVETQRFLPSGTAVRVRILYAGMNFVASGKVAFVRQNAGMGIVFTNMETNHESVLEKWIDRLRDTHT